MKLSIIIPVFNEEGTIQEVIKRVSNINLLGVTKEIVVVDDGSSDQTSRKIAESLYFKKLKFIRKSKNEGKGKAVREGMSKSTGDYIIIQDADLEYNPKDIQKLIAPIKDRFGKVVYGTRLKRLPNLARDEKTIRFMFHYLGNRFLSLLTSILYGQWITDMETCYKLFPRSALNKIILNSKGFEFEPEITAKLLKKGYKIIEVQITTNPRGYDEGKKLNTVRDGTIALWSLFKYRFFD